MNTDTFVPNADGVLDRLRDALGCKSDADLAREIGVPKTNISSWRQRNSVPYEICMRMYREKGIDLGWLMYGDEESKRPYPKSIHQTEEGKVGLVGRFGEYDEVKVLAIKAGAGNGKSVIESKPIGYLAFRRDVLRDRGLNPARMAWVEIAGDSMLPKLTNGDFVCINEDDCEIKSGKAYVLRVSNDIQVKYLSWLPDGNVEASSENSAVFKPFLIRMADLESGVVKVLGRVRFDNHEWD